MLIAFGLKLWSVLNLTGKRSEPTRTELAATLPVSMDAC